MSDQVIGNREEGRADAPSPSLSRGERDNSAASPLPSPSGEGAKVLQIDTNNLLELLGAIPEDIEEIIEVDVASFIPGATKPVIFKLKDLTTAEMYAAAKDAQKIKRRHIEWPDALCQNVAMLGLAHLSPRQGVPTGQFYMQVADTRGKLFSHLLNAYLKAFPHIANLDLPEDDADFLGAPKGS